ncbi:MAG: DNA-directed RNA polymerase subunit L [Candidatus Hodarchaeaceae archaeon]|nr:DNA-directed RNA polymerase subunit L [Candidatus Hodarchaeaceae archaeon]
MELELVEKGEGRLLIKIAEEGHTLCNLLRAELCKDENVVSAAYTIEHPLTESPKFYVKTKKGKSPERALIDAAGRIVEQLEDLRKQLQKALKKQ